MRANKMNAGYDARFFEQLAANRRSAEIVLPHVLDLVRPKSLVDVGCGIGVWSSVAAGRGVDVLAVDGNYVPREQLQIPTSRFLAHDLRERLILDRRFDLAVCMEVAEHLPTDRARSLVADLCGLADVVLFSAAIPRQGGTGHVNERWQSYWVHLFECQGYSAFDLIRPRIWLEQQAWKWYRQNVFIAAIGDAAESLRLVPQETLWDSVHPEYFEGLHRAIEAIGVRWLLRQFPGAMRREVARRRHSGGMYSLRVGRRRPAQRP